LLYPFSFEDSDLAAVVETTFVALYEVGCGDSKYVGCATPETSVLVGDLPDNSADSAESAASFRYSTSVPAYVVLAFGGFSSCWLFLAPLHLLRSQHNVPIANTTKTIETVMPIKTEGSLAADEARLVREGAACNIAERIAKTMGAILLWKAMVGIEELFWAGQKSAMLLL
jgi:hypothetical protein